MTPQEFITRWQDSGGAELANSQTFLNEFCDLIGVPHPDPTQADESQNAYVFEKAVAFNNNDGTTSPGRIDLYRRGCFVLESKQGVERKDRETEALATKTRQKKFRTGTAERGTTGWGTAMGRARNQAKRYAEALPDEWPPFLIVADVGHCFDVYADFTQSGKNYIPFPDPQSYRVRLADLDREDVRELFREIWLRPDDLDPAKRSAKVTRDVAERLARLAKSLEGQYPADTVAQFLMRCLFTMFAEDVEIGGFKDRDFTKFLESRRGKLDTFVPMLEHLWKTMDTGGFSTILEGQIKKFNGGLFENQQALPVSEDQLELLIEAAHAKWNDVEPAIFGTLLERALDPVERHKLGAHYTPRAYVERLVMPTLIEPLREEWDNVYASATKLAEDGKPKDAIELVRNFHQETLCQTTILDPACGSGNFLYVSLELMKRLEGEILNALKELGDKQQQLVTIDPHQFLGIEVNPRAAAITDLVLWIGYLQWHFRTRGREPISEPIIKKFHNIECRDAVLAWDAIEPVVDDDGNPVTRWDGRTTKPHPVTGEEVPDETARVQELRYINPRKAEWPKADYIVGNPPFVGKHRIKEALGDGYVEALRSTYSDLPHGIDFVMYWWDKAAELARSKGVAQFGLITTNSIHQSFSRRIVAKHIDASDGLSLAFAIPDHPWVDSADGADVRIAMTVGKGGIHDGVLLTVATHYGEHRFGDEAVYSRETGKIGQNLRLGPNVATCDSLMANSGLSFHGIMRAGDGFLLTPEEGSRFLLSRTEGIEGIVRPIINGRDVNQTNRGYYVIDAYGYTAKQLQTAFPEIYQHLVDHVKPQRDASRDKGFREK